MSVTSGRPRLEGVSETVAEVVDAEAGGEDEMDPSKKKTRVAERVPFHVPPEFEPRDNDFNVNEFLRSSPNPVVALIFGDNPKSSSTPWISCHEIPVSELWR